MPGAIIDIPTKQTLLNQFPEFEVIVKRDGETIYHNKTYAVVMNLVQSVTKLHMDTVELEGDTQILGVGHPIVQYFALLQLRDKMKKAGIVNMALGMINQVMKNPKLKKKIAAIAKKVKDGPTT